MSIADFIAVVSFGLTCFSIGYAFGKDINKTQKKPPTVQQNYATIFVITKIGLTVYRRHPISIIILSWFHTNVKKIPL